MLSIKDPVILYWLHTSGLLECVRRSLEEKLCVEIVLDIMSVKSQGKTPTVDVIRQFNREIQEEISSFKIESLETRNDQNFQNTLQTAIQKYSTQKLTIINIQQQSQHIKALIHASNIPNGVSEFENYYGLQNIVYIIARWNVADDVLAMFSKNDLSDSLHEQIVYYNKPDVKVEELTLQGKVAEFQGGQLWNCIYKNISHTYVKFRDSFWETGVKKVLLHTSHPKLLPGLNLLPPIVKLKPSKVKLQQLLSFLTVLQKKYPSHYPTIDSIFQSNGKLVVFSKENNYKINKGWLCYRVVYGQISYQGYLRWLRHNSHDEISKYNTTGQLIFSIQDV